MTNPNKQNYAAGSYVNRGVIAKDDWRIFYPFDITAPEFKENEKVILPFEHWLSLDHGCHEASGNLGVLLRAEDDVVGLVPFLNDIPVIIIWFDAFTDGRGFSLASTLRERFNYQGELRAAGFYLLDQLYYFKNCGFSSFTLRKDQNVDLAIAAWNEFSNIFRNNAAQQEYIEP